MRGHLESCPQCAREERKLAGLPALLATIEPDDVPPPELSPELEEIVLDRFVRERREPARQSRAEMAAHARAGCRLRYRRRAARRARSCC